MTKFIISLIFVFLFIEGAVGQSTWEDITSNFFTIYSKKGSEEAISLLFKSNKYLSEKPEAINAVKNQLKNVTGLIGEFYGYEFISKKSLGDNFLVATYFLKYERQPIRFTFVFYRPKDVWQIQNFKLDDKMEDELKEAVKIDKR